MKKTGWKQLALGIAGAWLCRISIMGCYPFVPAFFAAVYLEEKGRWLLSMGMLTGMAAFLPITAIAKYAMALLLTGTAIRLSEWVDRRCYTVVAALAASGGTMALSLFGGMFDIRNQVTAAAAVCEALFVFGFTILAARGVHLFLEEPEKGETDVHVRDVYQEQKLLNYARSFEGLSKTFLSMSRQTEIGRAHV